MKKDEWQVPLSSPDWECDWEGDERFHLRYFKSMSLEDKLRAIESMTEVAEFLGRKAQARKGPAPRPSGAGPE